MVTCRRIVVPVLERVGGFAKGTAPAAVRLRATGKRTDLWWHRPVRLVVRGRGGAGGDGELGDVAGAAGSDGFVEVPPRETGEGPWAYYGW